MACQELWTENFTDWAELDWIEGYTTGTYWVEEGWMEYDWVECEQTQVVVVETPTGNAGGSNKAGKRKKKHEWERIGHAISAIQTPPSWYYDVLPDDTPVQEEVTDAVEQLIEQQAAEIRTFEQLVSQIEKAIEHLKLEETKRVQTLEYRDKVRENYKRLVKRRKEEEALINILLHL